MGQFVVKQKNEKYAIWSTISDGYILLDATPKEILEEYVEESKDRALVIVQKELQLADEGVEMGGLRKPQFSPEDACAECGWSPCRCDPSS